MYKVILVPLDGSERAEAILPHVDDLARCYRAKVVFLQVVEPEPLIIGPDVVYPMINQDMMEERTKTAETYLATKQAEFRARGIEVETYVVHGPVVEEIITYADRTKADLIAMASHGRTGLSRVFYGSVAAGVLNKVDRPLFLIRSSDNN
jgi:nucleotide-binding universal stress UspA family protein